MAAVNVALTVIDWAQCGADDWANRSVIEGSTVALCDVMCGT